MSRLLGQVSRSVPMAPWLSHTRVSYPAAPKMGSFYGDGELLWSTDLLEDGELPVYNSAPVALADGSVLVTLKNSYVVIDSDGHLSEQMPISLGTDDSG